MHTLNRGGRAIGLDADCKLLLWWGCCGVCLGVDGKNIRWLIGVWFDVVLVGFCVGFDLVFGLFRFLTMFDLVILRMSGPHAHTESRGACDWAGCRW